MISMECPISRHGIPNHSYLFPKFSCVEPLSQLLSARRTKPKQPPRLLKAGSGTFEWTNGGEWTIEVVVFWHLIFSSTWWYSMWYYGEHGFFEFHFLQGIWETNEGSKISGTFLGAPKSGIRAEQDTLTQDDGGNIRWQVEATRITPTICECGWTGLTF